MSYVFYPCVAFQVSEDHTPKVFQVLPDRVNFGTVEKGCTYTRRVQLSNVGVNSRRFKIKPPPNQSVVKVHYSPGLVG